MIHMNYTRKTHTRTLLSSLLSWMYSFAWISQNSVSPTLSIHLSISRTLLLSLYFIFDTLTGCNSNILLKKKHTAKLQRSTWITYIKVYVLVRICAFVFVWSLCLLNMKSPKSNCIHKMVRQKEKTVHKWTRKECECFRYAVLWHITKITVNFIENIIVWKMSMHYMYFICTRTQTYI